MRSRLVALLCITAVAGVSWTATPFNPTSVPLAVRSPYLSCWLAGGNGAGNLAGQWPQFWTGMILGWAGYIRVDNTSYVFLGDPGGTPLATQIESNFTSTQSTFRQTAGPVTVTVSFLSPIDPNDLLRQSLPFSYMTVSVEPNDGGSHSVQVYSDITGEWVTGNLSLVANWSTNTGDIITHQIQLQTPELFSEINDHTQYGAAYFAVTKGGTYQTGGSLDVRAQFVNHSILTNTQDTNWRAVSDNWPVLAHAFDLGVVSTATEPIVFAVGHVRDPAIQYIVANGAIQPRRSYFFSKYDNVLDAISFFLGDYSNALSAANAFDAQVQSDATAISEDYAAIVALSARQAFGRVELTMGSSADDVLAFMKEGSDVNTVDVLFPAYPIFLYTNPEIARYLLEPLLQYQASGQYPNKWSVHDMGQNYPNATGHNDGTDIYMPVEESGNMVIMTAAYTKASGNTSLASSYYDLLQQWTTYVITNSLVPGTQLSTDNFAGPLVNQTNLAIKGIVGIAAMAQIATALGKTSDAQNYSSVAQSYASQFQAFATSKDGTHLDLSYGNDSSWGITYNLYADKLLGTNIFPQSIYDMQTAWYPNVHETYGFPLDSRHVYAKTDWSIFMSAAVNSNATRDLFIESVTAFQKAGLTSEPFPDLYDTNDGDQDAIQFRARAVVGGHFAHLALSKNNTLPGSSSTSGATSDATGSGLSKGAIAGIVVGAAVGFLLVLATMCYLIWRLKKSPRNQATTGHAIYERPHPGRRHDPLEPTPFLTPTLPTTSSFTSSVPVSPYSRAVDSVGDRDDKSARTNSTWLGSQRPAAQTAGRTAAPIIEDPQLAQNILVNAPTVDLVTVLNQRLRRELADNIEDPPQYA